ncbi:thioredoxin family protein [Sphingobacteriaceae bacterium WQ 2009]|uniref:Thioredoxin family protein n=1 Tax=Rhinopithecimicrobium faecis TaxID=2820698 RepID=A0A8T4H6G1_9SPHI|nr:thioredoxin family protein [Sphingobacteriaceae bacterium WQ 2009]
MKKFLLIGFLILLRLSVQAQEINWLSFPALADSLASNPKPILIFFHTDWCGYCRKMEKEVFTKPAIIASINANYYAVKFDGESKESFVFDGQLLKNPYPKRKNSLHEITLLLARRGNTSAAQKPIVTFPTTLIFNSEFILQEKSYNYLSEKQLHKLLSRPSKVD